MAAPTKTVKQGTECRQCCAFCDKMITPRDCIAAQCPFLYQYENEQNGRQYMGCLQKVFAVEIDVELFDHAERTRAGFGGVKAAREPLPMCPIKVERSYESKGAAFECTNRRFFDASELDPGGYRAFDLRDALVEGDKPEQ